MAIDIGAGDGRFVAMLAAAGATTVHAYEPHPDRYARLLETSRTPDGRCTCWQYATAAPGVPAVACGADGRVWPITRPEEAEEVIAEGGTWAIADPLEDILLRHLGAPETDGGAGGDWSEWSPPFTPEEAAARDAALLVGGEWIDPAGETRTLRRRYARLVALRLGSPALVPLLADAARSLWRVALIVLADADDVIDDAARILGPLGFSALARLEHDGGYSWVWQRDGAGDVAPRVVDRAYLEPAKEPLA